MMIKKFSVFFLVFVLLFCISACNIADENQNFGGSVQFFAYTPDTLNPLKTAYKTNAALLGNTIHRSLVTVKSDLSVFPSLAESWDFSDNGYTCTLQLRSDVYYTDGTPFSATHAKAAIDEAAENPNNLYYAVSEYVESCSASENILTLHLKKPGSGVLTVLDLPIPKDSDAQIGCGAYQITAADNNGLTLTAVANSENLANIETIYIRYYPKEDLWANAFLASEVDLVSCSVDSLSHFSSKTNITATNYITDKYTFLAFNTQSDIIPNAATRKAIACYLDKDTILSSLFAGYPQSTAFPFKPQTIFTTEKTQVPDFTYDVNKAEQYMQDTSVEQLAFSVLVNEENETKIKLAEAICKQLNQHGMLVTVAKLPYNDYLQAIQDGNYTAYIGETNIPADQDLTFLLHSSCNTMGYNNPQMDTLLNRFSNATEIEVKQNTVVEIEKLLQADVPLISLYYETNILLVSNKIQGVFAPTANNLYQNLNAWIAK